MLAQGDPLTPLDGTTYTTPHTHTLLATPHIVLHLLACMHTIHHQACCVCMPVSMLLCLHSCVHAVSAFLCPCCVCTFALHNTCHVCVLTCAAVCSCWFIHHNTIKPIRPHTVSQSNTQSYAHTDHTVTHILSLSCTATPPLVYNHGRTLLDFNQHGFRPSSWYQGLPVRGSVDGRSLATLATRARRFTTPQLACVISPDCTFFHCWHL